MQPRFIKSSLPFDRKTEKANHFSVLSGFVSFQSDTLLGPAGLSTSFYQSEDAKHA